MESKHKRIFGEISKTYACEIGSGSMIPVCCIDESSSVRLLHIVKKTHKRKYIFRHKSKYSPEKIPLEKLLVPGELPCLEPTSEALCSYSLEWKQSMNASLDIGKTGFVGSNVSASDTKAFKVNLETKKDEIDSWQLNDVLNNRQIDLKNQAVREIRKDPKASLCVITAVYSLVSETQIQKTHGRNAQAGVNSGVGGVVNIGVNGGVSSDNQKVIDLKEGTNLAYKVSELKIDTKSGRTKVALTEDGKGGFITMADAANAEGVLLDDPNRLQLAKNVMLPILQCTDEFKNKLQNLVYDLVRESSDVKMMIDLLDSDESEGKGVNPKQKDTWLSVLKMTGVENADGLSLRMPLVYILESLSELTERQLEFIKSLNVETAKDLLKLCKSIINGLPMVQLNKRESPVLHCPFAKQLAKEMGIRFTADGTLATLQKIDEVPPPVFEYVFWVLFAFHES